MNFDKLKKEFEHLDLTRDDVRAEFNLIEKIQSEEPSEIDKVWNSLTEREKRLKRVGISSVARKTLAYNKGLFIYEESITDLYEAICTTLEKLRTSGKENNVIRRLIIFLELERYNLNIHRDPRKIKNLHYSVAQNLIKFCLYGELEEFFLYEINLPYLQSKFYISDLLWEKEGNNFC